MQAKVGKLTCGDPFTPGKGPAIISKRQVRIPVGTNDANKIDYENKRDTVMASVDSPAAQDFLARKSFETGTDQVPFELESVQDLPAHNRPGGVGPEAAKDFTPQERDYLEQAQGINLEEKAPNHTYKKEKTAETSQFAVDICKRNNIDPDATVAPEQLRKAVDKVVTDYSVKSEIPLAA